MRQKLAKRTKRLLIVFYALICLSMVLNLAFDKTSAAISCIVLASGLITLYNRRDIKEIIDKLDEK